MTEVRYKTLDELKYLSRADNKLQRVRYYIEPCDDWIFFRARKDIDSFDRYDEKDPVADLGGGATYIRVYPVSEGGEIDFCSSMALLTPKSTMCKIKSLIGAQKHKPKRRAVKSSMDKK